jgi:hypothetical protein
MYVNLFTLSDMIVYEFIVLNTLVKPILAQ